MSAVADVYIERRPLLERLGSTIARLARHRPLVLGAASVGVLATFAGMLATGPSGPIATVMFVPWVALLAAELGPVAGSLAGGAATGGSGPTCRTTRRRRSRSR